MDYEGNMLLEQVMCLWGYEQGLEDQDVLFAVRENMFHEDGNLRFSIDHDNEGRLKIRVLPKRDRRSGGAAAATWGTAPGARPWGAKKPPEKRAPAMRGSVAQSGAAPKPMTTAKKLDMPLESLIETERAASSTPQPMYDDSDQAAYLRSAFEQATSLRESTRKNVHRAVQQMGLTPETSQFRQSGKGNWTPSGKYGRGRGSAWASQKGSEPLRPHSPMRSRRDGSRSPSPGDEDDALAEIARKTLNVSSSDRPLAANGITLDQKKPAPPPGDHWTKYEDDGNIWFYYEGPLGKFWCPGDNRDPQPYDDED